MIYVMSDLHGCYEKYKKMLSLIDLKEDDTLYILGDIVDRGADGIKIVLDLIPRKNVIALRGNHDYKAVRMLGRLMQSMGGMGGQAEEKQLSSWLLDGGRPTYEAFLSLEEKEKEAVLDYVSKMPFFKKIKVGGRMYFLSHTVPEKDRMPNPPDMCPEKDLILGEPDYEEVYFKDITLVTGHTPTVLIDREFKGRIWKGNNHIAVDCGAVFWNPLGCICLDNGKEYYVE